MYGVTLQDWLSLQGNGNSSNVIVQDESDWLDTSGYQDIVFWTQIGNADASGATLTLSFETAPVKDESAFMSMGSVTLSSAAAIVQVTPILMSTASSTGPVVVLGRWVRWKLSTSGVAALWIASFRIFASLNGPGPVM